MADFFDRMKDGLSKGVATVSTGSKNMIEKTKINTVIRGLEDEKKQLAEILGNKIYKFCMETVEGDISRAEVIGICNEITLRNERIEEQRQRIAALENEMSQVMGNSSNSGVANVCQCGHINVAGARFCAKCGNRLM